MANVTKADEIRELDQRLTVYESIIAGKSVNLIAKEMGIRPKEVRELMKDVYNTMSDGYHGLVENVRARTLARYEDMYYIANARAKGLPLPGDATDKNGNSIYKGVVDRHWMKLAVDILKAEMDLVVNDEQYIREQQAEGKKNLDARTVETITITRTSEMYKHAHEAEWQSWADTNLEEYLMRDDEPIMIEGRSVQEMSEDLKKMENELGEYIDEDDKEE